MRSKAEKLLVLLAVVSAIVLGGIHFGYRSEGETLKSRLDYAMLDYQRAVNACKADPLDCSKAKYLGSEFDRAADDLDEATGQARLFLVLAGGVPGALLVMWLGVRRLSRSVRQRTTEAPAVIPDC
jgi:hypothetical protein